MTNQIAIGLAIFIVGFFLLDHFVFHLDAMTVVLRKIVGAVKFMAFWREADCPQKPSPFLSGKSGAITCGKPNGRHLRS